MTEDQRWIAGGPAAQPYAVRFSVFCLLCVLNMSLICSAHVYTCASTLYTNSTALSRVETHAKCTFLKLMRQHLKIDLYMMRHPPCRRRSSNRCSMAPQGATQLPTRPLHLPRWATVPPRVTQPLRATQLLSLQATLLSTEHQARLMCDDPQTRRSTARRYAHIANRRAADTFWSGNVHA